MSKAAGRLVKRPSGEVDKLDIKNKAFRVKDVLRSSPGEGGVESYLGLGYGGSEPAEFVRWSSSMGIGDFILREARGKGFAVEIEALKKESRVEVSSFNDRTHYFRARL